jgi:hypothetical protein
MGELFQSVQMIPAPELLPYITDAFRAVNHEQQSVREPAIAFFEAIATRDDFMLLLLSVIQCNLAACAIPAAAMMRFYLPSLA